MKITAILFGLVLTVMSLGASEAKAQYADDNCVRTNYYNQENQFIRISTQSCWVNMKVTRYVESLYTRILGRFPSSGEARFQTGVILNSYGCNFNSLAYMLRVFYDSAEAKMKPQSNDQLVQALYRLSLGRIPGEGEVSFWSGIAGVYGQKFVIDAISGSDEAAHRGNAICQGNIL